MARKPSESDTGRNSKLDDQSLFFDEQRFVDGVFNDDYVLVVGNGVILDVNQKTFKDTGGDINQYILDEINKDRRKTRYGFVDHENFTEVFRGTPPAEPDPIYKLLTDDFSYDLSDISPELTQLLRTKLFKCVLTTCIDSYLETLMFDIWGEDLLVVNISDNQSLKDFQDALKQSRGNKYSRPTLFYVFGKVIKGRPKPRGFVETDVDAIKIIEKWMLLDTNYIVPFLKSKRLLALGCKFDDWYFRFFWYILTRGFDDTDRYGNLLSNDNLATMFNPNSSSDKSLKEYLNRRGVCMHDDAWKFMKDIHSLLASTALDSPFRQMVIKKRKEENCIFISYKSCDVFEASRLFCRLVREGLNVWFDNASLDVGDEYKKVIRNVITNKAKIFIPILSPEVAAELRIKDLEYVLSIVMNGDGLQRILTSRYFLWL